MLTTSMNFLAFNSGSRHAKQRSTLLENWQALRLPYDFKLNLKKQWSGTETSESIAGHLSTMASSTIPPPLLTSYWLEQKSRDCWIPPLSSEILGPRGRNKGDSLWRIEHSIPGLVIKFLKNAFESSISVWWNSQRELAPVHDSGSNGWRRFAVALSWLAHRRPGIVKHVMRISSIELIQKW